MTRDLDEDIAALVVRWLETERERALEAMSAWNIPPSVEVRRTIVTEATETRAWVSYGSANVSPMSIPDFAWRASGMVWDDTFRRDVARALHERFDQKCNRFTVTETQSFDKDPEAWVTAHLLDPLQTVYVASLPSLSEPSTDVAYRLAHELLEHVSRDSLRRVDLLPMAGLRLEGEEMHDSRFVVRVLTLEELGDLSDAHRDFFRPWSVRLPREVHPPTRERVVVEAVSSFDKTTQPRDERLLARFVIALQLLGFQPHGRGRAACWTEPLPYAMTGSTDVRLARSGAITTLGREVFGEVVRLAAKIPPTAVDAPVSRRDLALHRFYLGAVEEAPTEQLLNFVIALEALLLPRSFEGELGFRFALYGARYMGGAQSERERTFKELQSVYRMRSKVVHGTTPPSPKDLADAATTARRLAERLFVRALKKGWPEPGEFKDEALRGPVNS